LSSGKIEDGDDFVVAIMYPIQDMTPSNPPAIINTDSCKTIGLHSESISKYAYTKNPTMQEQKIRMPVVLRRVIAKPLARVIST
jgi:hypothetical protein